MKTTREAYESPADALAAIVGVLENVSERGGQYEARCPAHEDRNPSFAVALGDGGKVLMKCRAGCGFGAIVGALSDKLAHRGGLTPSDLFPPKANAAAKRVVANYDYRDADGNPALRVVRFEPKDFRQQTPDGAGGWKWGGTKGVTPVPYRLPELLAADPAEPVVICEGEKDADALAARGFMATTNAGGAGKWREELSEPFRGRHVVVCPDPDDAGRMHAEDVAEKLASVAASVRVMGPLPDGYDGTHKDPAEFFAAGRSTEEFRRCMDAAAAPETLPGAEETGTEKRPVTVSLADLLAGFRDELDEPAAPALFLGNSFRHLRFAAGSVMVLGGRPGAGKSALASQWVADLLAADDDARVLVCNVEMSPTTLRDRLLARLSGIPYGMIRDRVIEDGDGRIDHGIAELATFADRLHFLRPLYDMGHVAAAADRVGATVIVLDYIQRIGVPADKRREATETRARVNVVMDEMRRHAHLGRAVLGLSALSRGRDARGQSKYGIDADLASFKESGEIDYGVNDAVILVPQPEDESLKLLRHVKSRDGEMQDVWLRFHGPQMSFVKTEPPR